MKDEAGLRLLRLEDAGTCTKYEADGVSGVRKRDRREETSASKGTSRTLEGIDAVRFVQKGKAV